MLPDDDRGPQRSIGNCLSRRSGYHSIRVPPTPPPSIGKVFLISGEVDFVGPTIRAQRIRRDCNNRSHRRFSMKLSAPIYHLKRKARLLSREKKIPLHEALDRIAIEEGFR